MKKIFVVIFCVVVGLVKAQDSTTVNKDSINISPGITSILSAQTGLWIAWTNKLTYEQKVTNRLTIDLQAGTAFTFQTNKEGTYWDPLLKVGIKYYVNVNHRQSKNKNTLSNAFSSFQLSYTYGPRLDEKNENSSYLAVNYGFRRNIKQSRFYFEFLAGATLMYEPNEPTGRYWSPLPLTEVTFGYNFSRKKKK